MDNIVRRLGADALVLDLGCGPGSFNYSAYTCNIVGVDSTIPNEGLYADSNRIAYVRALSHELPLPAGSVDAVISNHSMEHIVEYDRTLGELRRVLKPTGFMWISVPNGFGFDDALYRFLYSGGGHVNRFSYESLRTSVESATGLKLLQSITLVSGFNYTQAPSKSSREHLPRRLKLLHRFRPVSTAIPLALNSATRTIDRILRTRFSVYGWGFVFGPAGAEIGPMPSYFNVCAHCGCGEGWARLSTSMYRQYCAAFYNCPRCGKPNLLFRPLAGYE